VLARRLVLRLKPGDQVQIGDRIGLMKFGSRMDVLVPPDVEVLVRRGQRVIAGVTVIGRMSCEPRRGADDRVPNAPVVREEDQNG